MRSTERGFLLLTSHLGDPERNVLTVSQMRTLTQRIRNAPVPVQNRELCEEDIRALGYNTDMARRIVKLLEEEELLMRYLQRGTDAGCRCISRVSDGYPLLLRQRLGLDSPGCLWVKGDVSLFHAPAVALVGSRELRPENRGFAEAVGRMAAQKDWVLVSGNARGADRAAQEACLKEGGRVISIVADELSRHPSQERVLYVSEDGFDEPFSAQRALSRNRCIHALGQVVFVAQSDLHRGGTWDGTAKNLHFGWSPVLCHRDGSEAANALEQLGAYLIGVEELKDYSRLLENQLTFF